MLVPVKRESPVNVMNPEVQRDLHVRTVERKAITRRIVGPKVVVKRDSALTRGNQNRVNGRRERNQRSRQP